MKKVCLMLFVYITVVGTCDGQITRVRGYVLDNESESPLSYASIVVPGMPDALTARENGYFELAATFEGKKARVSRIGFATQEVELTSDSVMYIHLVPEISRLPVMHLGAKKYDGPESYQPVTSGDYSKEIDRRTAMNNEGEVQLESPADFPGGMSNLYAFIYNEFQYPQAAIDDKQRGVLYVQFEIGSDGKVKEVSWLEGEGENGMKEEIIRVLGNMPPWYPAVQNTKGVDQSFIAAFPFVAR